MPSVQIAKILVIILFPILSVSQNVSSVNGFIAYKYPYQVDSLLTKVLDSTSVDQLKRVMIYMDLRKSYFVRHGKDVEYDCRIRLLYVKDLNEQMNYLDFLLSNTNHFYVSLNKKYKIPIIFNEDYVYIQDGNAYKTSYLGSSIINFTLMNDSIIHFNYNPFFD